MCFPRKKQIINLNHVFENVLVFICTSITFMIYESLNKFDPKTENFNEKQVGRKLFRIARHPISRESCEKSLTIK